MNILNNYFFKTKHKGLKKATVEKDNEREFFKVVNYTGSYVSLKNVKTEGVISILIDPFMYLVQNCGFDKEMVSLKKLVEVKLDRTSMLVPIDSEVYEIALKNVSSLEQKISNKDLVPGSKVVLFGAENEATYLGTYFILTASADRIDDLDRGNFYFLFKDTNFEEMKIKRNFYLSEEGNIFISNSKILDIKGLNEEFKEKSFCQDYINKKMKKTFFYDTKLMFIFHVFTSKYVKKEEINPYIKGMKFIVGPFPSHEFFSNVKKLIQYKLQPTSLRRYFYGDFQEIYGSLSVEELRKIKNDFIKETL